MIINDIKYYVVLYIVRKEGFPEYEAHFEDFQELNMFIRKNLNNIKYLENQMAYSLVEAVDGKPDALSWFSNIQWKEFSDEQIHQEIEDFIESEKEIIEEFERIDEFSKEIHYFEGDEDYQSKRSHFKDLSYVCPRCLHEVTDCRCATYPYYLVQIDKLMVPIIRELNSKGYKTTACCAGHPDNKEEFKGSGIYIAFAENYEFDEDFPDGGKYSLSRHTLTYHVPEDCEDLVEFQRKTLWQLEDWAEMLFGIDFWNSDEDDEIE